MRKVNLSFLMFAVILGLAVVPASSDGGKRRRFEAILKGINEVGTGIGAVSMVASGSFRATLSENGTTISYRLRYSDLEADITQAYIHVGQFQTAGGISFWPTVSALGLFSGSMMPAEYGTFVTFRALASLFKER